MSQSIVSLEYGAVGWQKVLIKDVTTIRTINVCTWLDQYELPDVDIRNKTMIVSENVERLNLPNLPNSTYLPGVPRRHSFRHRRQPDSTRSALCRRHAVSATEVPYVYGRARFFLLRPTRMECSPFNTSRYPRPRTIQKTTQESPLRLIILA